LRDLEERQAAVLAVTHYTAITGVTPSSSACPGNHGCVSMLDDQALLLWQFADIGTPLRIRR
jgi:hypothetical protein